MVVLVPLLFSVDPAHRRSLCPFRRHVITEVDVVRVAAGKDAAVRGDFHGCVAVLGDEVGVIGGNRRAVRRVGAPSTVNVPVLVGLAPSISAFVLR